VDPALKSDRNYPITTRDSDQSANQLIQPISACYCYWCLTSLNIAQMISDIVTD